MEVYSPLPLLPILTAPTDLDVAGIENDVSLAYCLSCVTANHPLAPELQQLT